ncbi:MAG: HNH endonuclease [Actinomycetota bacterium]|nr:HNH endonuclease [Actinomycetota bacterium]
MTRLAERVAESGGFLSRTELSDFDVGDGRRRRLIDTSRGIWNPRDLAATLSIVSSPDSRYNDEQVEEGFFRYDYRVGSVEGDNAKLRRASELGFPLILLLKMPTGGYAPVLPVFVIADDRPRRQFRILVDESLRIVADRADMSELEKRYADQITRRRLHQPMFRAMVVRAYEVQCSICRLRHGDLLDAAHITPDSEETGLASVSNGLSLCKIHHAAYDRNLLAITPGYRVEINQGLLEEVDGPMLKHGLQEMHGATILLPTRRSDRPDRERLALRYEAFKAS